MSQTFEQIVLEKHKRTPKSLYVEDTGFKLEQIQDNVKLMSRDADDPSGPIFVRGSATIENCTIKEWIECVGTVDKDYRKQWDPLVYDLKLVEHIRDDWKVFYIHFKSNVYLVSDRDFVYARNVFYSEDGKSCFLVSVSVEHEKCPPVSGIVRGGCVLAGWYLEEIHDEKSGKTDLYVVYLAQTDFAGWIPASVARSNLIDQPMNITRVAKLLNKTLAKQ
jgi:hypothetical protein